MRSTILSSICVIFLLFFSKCSAPKSDQAEVGEAIDTLSVVEPTDAFLVNAKQSIVTWIGTKPTGQHNGIIPIASGTLQLTRDQRIAGGSITVDVASLQVMDPPKGKENNAKLTDHLRSEDFFHTAIHPTATFEILEVTVTDSSFVYVSKEEFRSKYTPASMDDFMIKNPTHRVTGNLTMRGITKNISFPAIVMISDNQIKADAKFNIDRTDWNLSYDNEASVADKARDSFIYNTVNVGFSIIAIRENPLVD